MTDRLLIAAGSPRGRVTIVRGRGLGGSSASSPQAALNQRVEGMGDSIMANDATWFQGYFNQSGVSVPYSRTTGAAGGSGMGVAADRGSGVNTMWAKLDAVLALNPQWIILQIGYNDLAANYYANRVKPFLDTIKTELAGVKIAVASLYPMGDQFGSQTTFNANAAAYAADLRAGHAAGDFHAYLPIYEALTVEYVTNNSSDGQHISTYQGGNGAVYAALTAFLRADSDDAVVEQFSFVDFNDVATGTRTAQINIAGTTSRSPVTATIQGQGTFRSSKHSAFGTAPLANLLPGDMIETRIEATAPATSYAATVTIGQVSDTFDVKTVGGASSRIVINEGAALFSTPGTFETTRTYEAVSFPAGRPLLAFDVANTQLPDSVHIDGVQATRLVSSKGHLYLGPQILAAGDYPVTIVRNAAGIGDLSLFPQGLVNMGPGGTVTSTALLDHSYRGDGPHTANGPINVPANGLGYVFYFNDQGGPGTGFALPEGWTLEKDWGGGYYTLSFNSTQTPQVEALIFGTYTAMLCAGFAPA